LPTHGGKRQHWRMSLRIPLLAVLAFMMGSTLSAATVGETYLRYIFGDEAADAAKICWPNDDLWMARGEKNSAALDELTQEKISHGRNEVLWVTIQNSLCIVEVRDGKVDPRFVLDQVFLRHRQAILQFVYAALKQDTEALSQLATKPSNVKFGRAKPPAGGDLDVYQEVVSTLPVVRVSAPADDKKSRSITYRVPLGKKGLQLRLVKRGGRWLIDSDERLDVPLEFFFE
jgi:hypothetical protein